MQTPRTVIDELLVMGVGDRVAANALVAAPDVLQAVEARLTGQSDPGTTRAA